jgi:GMP synthase (glutamine-hydrolysing)
MRILSLVHQADAGPGVFVDAVAEVGADLELCRPDRGGRPAEDLGCYDAVLCLGGGMHIDQEVAHPWLRTEKQLLLRLIELRVPLLTVCLGAQLLAEAAGASVNRASVAEIGWYQITTTEQASDDPLFADLVPGFEGFEWHSYEFALPPRAVPLAHSEQCLQAYRLGSNAWGIQFHAEVTRANVESWIDEYRSDPDAVALGIDPRHLRAETQAVIGDWNQLGRELCQRFLAAARTRRRVGRRVIG